MAVAAKALEERSSGIAELIPVGLNRGVFMDRNCNVIGADAKSFAFAKEIAEFFRTEGKRIDELKAKAGPVASLKRE